MTYWLRSIVLLILFCNGVTAEAQTFTSLNASATSPSSTLVSPVYVRSVVSPIKMDAISPGKAKRTIGISMVALGACIQGAGVVLIKQGIDAENEASKNPGYGGKVEGGGLTKMIGGLIVVVAGTGVAVPGTILWIKGSRKYNSYKHEQQQSLHFKIDSGVSLCYRF